MRRFALGCLGYTPDRFGLMLVGDFLDAMAGFNEGENDRIKSTAELIRTATTILRNTQPMEGGALSAHQLWPFSWDKEAEEPVELAMSEEERLKRESEANNIFNNIAANGNSNIKS
jgi:hypothetical protein